MVAFSTPVRASLTLAAAAVAGWTCNAAGLPLGWLVGPMLTMIGAALLGLSAVQPTLALPWVKSSVGTLLGAAITWPVLLSLSDWWISLLAMVVVMGAGVVMNYQMLRRAFGFQRMDAALCSSPGGIAEMILLSEGAGADSRRVAIVHSMRIALAILIMPFLISFAFGVSISPSTTASSPDMSLPDWGWFGLCILSGVLADRFTRIPLPFVTVPAVLCAILHLTDVTHFAVPETVSKIMQLVIGLNVGARFQNAKLRQLVPVFGAAFSVFGLQMVCAIAGTVIVANVSDFDPLTLTLAFAPGGLAEMSLIAIAMGRDVAFVGLHHLFRVLAALVGTPLVIRMSERDVP